MQNRKPHSQKAPQTGHSIFGTILFSLLAVLAVEILLLTFAAHATRLGPQLNQNAEDILAMQVMEAAEECGLHAPEDFSVKT